MSIRSKSWIKAEQEQLYNKEEGNVQVEGGDSNSLYLSENGFQGKISDPSF